MKKMKLPAMMTALAVLGFVLRWLVYRMAVDGKNLIVSGHPSVTALWVLTAAALSLAAVCGWKRKGAKEFEETFAASAPAFLGHGMLGVGMLMAVLLNPLPMPGLPGLFWKVLGAVSPPCLLMAGFQRMQGKKPFFALYAVPCLFFAVHVVAHYQIWCSNPQFTDYAFALLATVMLALHTYQLTAYCVDMGEKRLLVFTGLAVVYLCGAELAGSMYPYLYLGSALFCLTALPSRE